MISEWSKPFPADQVMDWMYAQPRADLAISVLTYHEVIYGIEKQDVGQRRTRIEEWFARDLRDIIQDRIIPVGRLIAQRWTEIRAEARAKGCKIPELDSGIMATASVYGLTVVTRDLKHFGPVGLPIVNPWVDG